MEVYSAGLISQSFWFVEFKKVVRLLSDGRTRSEAKAVCIDENLLGASNTYRAKRMAGYLTNRAAALDANEIRLFMESDLATQKLLNLIAILRTDRLFFEFLFEVYREKRILGSPTIENYDANIFFRNKERESSAVEAWQDSTKRKLRSNYFNFMVDANLLALDGKTRKLTPPILDITLEQHLRAKGDSAIIKAITGVI